MKIADVAGREFPAKTVFTQSIKALADLFKLHLQTKTMLKVIKMDDIIWALTVPAIWTDAAKDFMRKCAIDVSKLLYKIFRYQLISTMLFFYYFKFLIITKIKVAV